VLKGAQFDTSHYPIFFSLQLPLPLTSTYSYYTEFLASKILIIHTEHSKLWTMY